MKLVVGSMLLAALSAAAIAQTPAPDARIYAAELANAERLVKGSPFSADAVSESVQVLLDGNRIVHSSTSKIYRNGEGRVRREYANGTGGVLGATFTVAPSVSIVDPVIGYSYLLDEKMKTAQQALVRVQEAMPALKAGAETLRAASVIDQAAAEKIRVELSAAKPLAPVAPLTATGPVTVVRSNGEAVVAGSVLSTNGVNVITPLPVARSRYETRTEQLGTQAFEGVEAEGTRTITTIPAGAIGNERPIETTYERWFSKELQMVVFSRSFDPRSGEQTYRLTNINRNEPDPALFSLPSGYRIVTPSSVNASPARVEVERAAAAAKSPQATTTYVKRP